MMMGFLGGWGVRGGVGSYNRSVDTLVAVWYQDKQRRGFESDLEQRNAWAMRQDWPNYVKRNCP